VKFLNILFAFYLFLSPFFPCGEAVDCNENTLTELKGLLAGVENDHQDEESCNPFCSCACCGQVFTTGDKLAKTGPSQNVNNQVQNHLYANISLPSDFFGNIWQPPRNS
jgi:hypothetical protein